MRYLAIDLGAKRTGLAVGDDRTHVVTPLRVITTSSRELLLETLVTEIATHAPDVLVVGLPLNMDGGEGHAVREVRAFAARVSSRLALPVHFQDERLTSYAADQHMARSGRTHRQKKDVRDAIAAAEILRDFLQMDTDASVEPTGG